MSILFIKFLITIVFKKQLSRSEEHTSELQSRPHLVCRLLLEKKNQGPRAYARGGLAVTVKAGGLRRAGGHRRGVPGRPVAQWTSVPQTPARLGAGPVDAVRPA